MKSHDWKNCWVCQTTRGILVFGLLAMGFVCLTASLSELFRGHWLIAGREFLGVPFCVAMIYLGLFVMTKINEFWDWVFAALDAKIKT